MEGKVPVADGLFELHGDELVLIGGYSPSSSHHHFPLSDTCPYSGARDIEPVELSSTGRLWAWTTVTLPPPGYKGEVPYGFGVVELPEGLRIVTRLTECDVDALEFGQLMRLVPDRVHQNEGGAHVIVWSFAPEGEVSS